MKNKRIYKDDLWIAQHKKCWISEWIICLLYWYNHYIPNTYIELSHKCQNMYKYLWQLERLCSLKLNFTLCEL